MLDKHSDPAKIALGAVGAIPFCVRKKKPMLATLKKILFWTVATFLVLIVFALGGYIVGANDGYVVGRLNGLTEGVNYTLTQAAKHGCGLWIAEPGPDGQPVTKFVFLDDLQKQLEGKTQHDSDPFNFNPMAPKHDDGIKQIGPPGDRGANMQNNMQFCIAGGGGGAIRAGTYAHEQELRRNAITAPIEKLLTPEDPQTGITTLHSDDVCDPLNFLYFLLFLLIVAGGSAVLAMVVHRIHVWRKSRLAH